jgi:hypothetical protein
VYFGMRYGVIAEIYEGDRYHGAIAKIIPEFSYNDSGLYDRDTGLPKEAEFCAQHLGIMHHDDAVEWETFVNARNKCSKDDPSQQKNINEKNPHPYAPWSAVLRTTSNSAHRPKQHSHLRISASTLVYLHDPRLEKCGALDKKSTALLREVVLKSQETASYNPADRKNVDVSRFPWLQAMDRFSPDRVRHSREQMSERQDSATVVSQSLTPPKGETDANALSANVPKSSETVLRSDSKTNISSPKPNTAIIAPETYSSSPKPAEVTVAPMDMLKSITDQMSGEDRLHALTYIQNRLQSAYRASSVIPGLNVVNSKDERPAKRKRLSSDEEKKQS